MLVIRNTYDDRNITITPRHRATGADGQSVTLEAGGVGHAFEIDGDHEIVISTRAREPGEDPLHLETMTSTPVEGAAAELSDEEKAAAAAADAKTKDKDKVGEKAA